MDPPQHRDYRRLTSPKFTPRAMMQLEPHFEEMAKIYVGSFAKVLADGLPDGESVDFVHELACKLPVAAICEMAEIPRDDWEKIFHWTEVLVGSGDPEYQVEGETRRYAKLGIEAEVTSASPYLGDARIDAAREAGRRLRGRQVDLVWMTCVGMDERMREAVQEEAQCPVILAQALLGRLVAELVAGVGSRVPVSA